jgi:asparagine synthase (glutamine-hydrolysing)
MRDFLIHRGPDDAGVYIDGRVGLGHRRLSIVDLNGGRQPMSNEDGTVWVSFNGEIYNHRDLRPALEEAGHQYRTSSDTETIVHLYEQYGVKAPEQLRGMFAFAIWDSRTQHLLLARDRLGIKPLYYTVDYSGALYFASEIKSLIESGVVTPELNWNALSDYLANRYTSGEETLFAGVKRLLPGHILVWNNGTINISPYWNLSFSKAEDALPEKEYVDRFSSLFRESVQLRLMADVPLGMFLSGGIDSSAIAAVMSQLVSEPIKTFSVAFEEREANELKYARSVSEALGTDHHEIVVSPEQFFASLAELIYQEDEPIAHPSSIPLYFVSSLAAQHVKVVLTGEGSDELLAGYDKYRKTIFNIALGKLYHSGTSPGIRERVEKTLKLIPGPMRAKQKLERTFLFLQPDIEEIYFDNFSVFSRSRQQGLLSGSTIARIGEINPYLTSLKLIDGSSSDSLLDQLLAADMKTYLHELLMKQDQMSMAASIESRVPFLDHKLVEFAASLPVRMKLRGLTTKYILRKAMAGVLPNEILTRKKMGFPVPVGTWLRGKFGHIIEEYVLSPRTLSRNVFNDDSVRQLVARHRAGEDHTERLWALINFEIWQRRFIDREEPIADQAGYYPDSASSTVWREFVH